MTCPRCGTQLVSVLGRGVSFAQMLHDHMEPACSRHTNTEEKKPLQVIDRVP